MKKYTKPAIEEYTIGATMPLMLSDSETPGYGGDPGTGGEMLAPGKKGAPDDDYGFETEGW